MSEEDAKIRGEAGESVVSALQFQFFVSTGTLERMRPTRRVQSVSVEYKTDLKSVYENQQ